MKSYILFITALLIAISFSIDDLWAANVIHKGENVFIQEGNRNTMVPLFSRPEGYTGKIFQSVAAKTLVQRYQMGQMAKGAPRIYDIVLKAISNL